MTKKELVITTLGIILILFTIFYPPWKQVRPTENSSFEYSKDYGYELFFSPPVKYGGYNGDVVYLGSTIDIPRLLMLWTAIILVCGYFILIPRILIKNNPKEIKEPQNEN